MTLTTTAKQELITSIYKEYLYQGIIPTTSQIENRIQEYENNNIDYLSPSIKNIDTDFDFGSNSSASKLNNIKTAIINDTNILNQEMFFLVNQSRDFYYRWNNEFKKLNNKAIQIENEIDSLLLLTYDTYGYYGFVYDIFTDLNKVDTENSTVKINTNEGIISIEDEQSDNDSSSGSLIDTSNILDSDITFTPITKRDNTSYTLLNEFNKLSNVLKYNNSMWAGKITTKTSGPMIAEMKIAINKNKNIEVSKVTMDFNSNYSSASNITLQYSTDGYSWNLVPISTPTKTLNSRITWSFPTLSMKWVKFIFYKDAPDTISNEYFYSSSFIKFYNNSYSSSSDTLISKPLYALNEQNNIVKFYKVALDACEELQENTDINYYISVSNDNTVWSDWIQISPSNRQNALYPKVLNINGAIISNNDNEDNITKIDSSVISGNNYQKRITTIFDDSYTGYKFKNESFGVVNTAILMSENDDPNIISDSISIWRNVRDTSVTSDTSLVRNNIRGWGKNGNEYYCYFEIINPTGVVIDFGNTKCKIDNIEVTGIYNIEYGIHKFSTTSEYWFDISNNITSSTDLSTEESIKEVDLLYPYNHKLLIEGFKYSDTFNGNKIYLGSNISAEYYCNRVSLFELENNTNLYNKFAIRNIGTENNPVLGVILLFDVTNSDYVNELITVKWKSTTSINPITGQTVYNGNMYKYIKLKATLLTDNLSISPLLSSYRLKLGI